MRPVFESEVSGVLRRAHGNIAISEFHATNKNRISMRGSLTMAADRKLSGNLEVGVTDAIIKASRNSCFDSLFGPSTEGFRWLNLKIGGTATTPTDNFRVLYEAATQETTPDSSAEIPTFEELTRPK